MRALTAITSFVCMLHAAAAQAVTSRDAVEAVNVVRASECKAKGTKPFVIDSKLNEAAARFKHGGSLREAFAQVDYRADKSAAVRLTGKIDTGLLERALHQKYCDILEDASLTRIGVHATDGGVWIVFAAPFDVPAPKDANVVAIRALQLVNEARAKSRRCGRTRFAAAPPLTLNKTLNAAALAHSKDMAKRGAATHTGSDGSSPGDRATRTGYVWRAVGENVAGGQLNAEEVVQSWLDSPHHCGNIMSKDFTEMGLAFAVNRVAELGIFWTQAFGKPRSARCWLHGDCNRLMRSLF